MQSYFSVIITIPTRFNDSSASTPLTLPIRRKQNSPAPETRNTGKGLRNMSKLHPEIGITSLDILKMASVQRKPSVARLWDPRRKNVNFTGTRGSSSAICIQIQIFRRSQAGCNFGALHMSRVGFVFGSCIEKLVHFEYRRQ